MRHLKVLQEIQAANAGVFPCTRCGLCCRRMHLSELPHLDRGDGTCRHLLPGEFPGEFICGIYETRPEQCRIDKTVPAHMTIDGWYAANAHACVVLKAQPVLESELTDIERLDGHSPGSE